MGRVLGRIAVVLGLALVLAGCSKLQAEPDADRLGRRFIDAVQRDDWPAIDPALSAGFMADPDHAPKIVLVRDLFPKEPPWRIKLIESERTRPPLLGRETQVELSTLRYLYGFSGREVAVDLTVELAGTKRVYDRGQKLTGKDPFREVKLYRVVAITAQPVTSAAVKANGFLAPGKGLVHLAFLVGLVGSPVIMVLTAVAAARSPGLKFKWWWVLGAFVGVGTVWINWTTGALGAQWQAVNLFGVAATKGQSPLAPWIFHFAPPIGALVVLLRLKTLPRQNQP
ncbi:hypothetical protein [Phenylobacterium sp.]|uniref:hypothetical protein n=1 Tax=Phenylobacterium sp. TaxID=1871053 RepID=UPI0035B4801F